MRTVKRDKRIRFIVFIVLSSFADAQDVKILGMSGMLHQAKMPEMKIAMIATGAM